MDDVRLEITEEASRTITDMESRVARIGQAYGEASPEYLKASQSLMRALATVLRLGGRVMRDGELSLICNSFITYGVIFFAKRNDNGERDELLGDWSAHS